MKNCQLLRPARLKTRLKDSHALFFQMTHFSRMFARLLLVQAILFIFVNVTFASENGNYSALLSSSQTVPLISAKQAEPATDTGTWLDNRVVDIPDVLPESARWSIPKSKVSKII